MYLELLGIAFLLLSRQMPWFTVRSETFHASCWPGRTLAYLFHASRVRWYQLSSSLSQCVTVTASALDLWLIVWNNSLFFFFTFHSWANFLSPSINFMFEDPPPPKKSSLYALLIGLGPCTIMWQLFVMSSDLVHELCTFFLNYYAIL